MPFVDHASLLRSIPRIQNGNGLRAHIRNAHRLSGGLSIHHLIIAALQLLQIETDDRTFQLERLHEYLAENY
jgi:hypothetical protein